MMLTAAGSSCPDRWDVATALARLLFKKPSLDKSLRIESLLFSSEDSLRRRGFQIDGARKVPSPPLGPGQGLIGGAR